MPKKVKQDNNVESIAEGQAAVQSEPKKADAKNTKKKAEPKKDSEAKKDSDAKQAKKKPEAKKDTEADAESDAEVVRVSRQVPTRESVEKEFDDVIASVDEEIEKLRDQAAKSKGVKFLRTLNKRLKALKTHSLRVSKQRTATRRNNTNSGFLKPVQISKDLAKFTGWNPSELRSRVDVTKFICNYIREHNLQDPNDRRRIRIEDDQNLKKLLKFEDSADKPLTYYSLQTYLKGHFVPVESDQAKPEAKPKKAVAGKQ